MVATTRFDNRPSARGDILGVLVARDNCDPNNKRGHPETCCWIKGSLPD